MPLWERFLFNPESRSCFLDYISSFFFSSIRLSQNSDGRRWRKPQSGSKQRNQNVKSASNSASSPAERETWTARMTRPSRPCSKISRRAHRTQYDILADNRNNAQKINVKERVNKQRNRLLSRVTRPDNLQSNERVLSLVNNLKYIL